MQIFLIVDKKLHFQLGDYKDAVIDELFDNEKVDFIVAKDLRDFKKTKNDILSSVETIKIIEDEID